MCFLLQSGIFKFSVLIKYDCGGLLKYPTVSPSIFEACLSYNLTLLFTFDWGRFLLLYSLLLLLIFTVSHLCSLMVKLFLLVFCRVTLLLVHCFQELAILLEIWKLRKGCHWIQIPILVISLWSERFVWFFN